MYVRCQKFIELIKRDKLDEAVVYGQEVRTQAPALYILKGRSIWVTSSHNLLSGWYIHLFVVLAAFRPTLKDCRL